MMPRERMTQDLASHPEALDTLHCGGRSGGFAVVARDRARARRRKLQALVSTQHARAFSRKLKVFPRL